ncbi:Wzz/FepE/Etk N-terminal domain-containing protein [Pullulanibacillus sp. KACC 23026]|uniref:YveK family protein n=1 Tax=Pullulanibacillus sp. KACC 23026 TaxID=3028315 RepID=UPI0023B18D8C|nr:Wzz/FepE/Etk N-terminal domain-containing protein [Pullulanibacillus sp. KACC 23026]WEG13381.1 Wzz/FepE/Etk N-terminal domain-containing protein [Pullulanibacillus sp. KACC 23026]
MEETISLQEIYQTIKKRIVLIVIITLLATVASGIFTKFFVTPKYDASTQVLVNQASSNQNSQIDYTQVQTNVQLINTYSVIIKSPTILNEVIRQLHLNLTADDLGDMITVNSAENSQVFTVTVESDGEAKSVRIANAVASAFKKKIQSLMKVDNVSILSKASIAEHASPVKPNLKMNVAIGFVVGLMISIGLAFLLEFLDKTIKTEEDIERYLELPVLGAITEMGDVKRHRHQATSASKAVRGGQIGI